MRRNTTRKNRSPAKKGGFSPSIMGSFVANVESAIVPMAMYALYRAFVPKSNATSKTRKSGKKISHSNKMVHHARSRKYKGGGYFTDIQYFAPGALSPAAWSSAPSTSPTGSEIRPVLASTFKGGKRRKNTRKNTRKNRK